MDDPRVTATPILLYLANGQDVQRFAVGPALAAAAERSGWGFECYYGALRRGRHFGGGDPDEADDGVPNGSLVVGGRHLEQAYRLATRRPVVALGDRASVLWPALEDADAEILVRASDPATLYDAALQRLAQDAPARLIVVDAAPQGRDGLVVAPFLYPEFLDGPAALGLEASAAPQTLDALVGLGTRDVTVAYVSPERARALGADETAPRVADRSYAALTTEISGRHAAWGRGVLLADPELVAAQLPKARRLRLLPLYGRPQTEVIEKASDIVVRASSPVWGRQYDDFDFVALGKRGRPFQLLDPGPPFDAESEHPVRVPRPLETTEPDDEQLRRWAGEGRVLATLLLWAGMVRELDCWPRLFDVVAASDLRTGLVLTTPAVLHGSDALAALSAPREGGGIGEAVEILLASAGSGVCAETLMPEGTLGTSLAAARADAEALLGAPIRGWWPLLDAPLRAREPQRLARRGRRPVILFSPRGAERSPDPATPPKGRRDLRSIARSAVVAARLESLLDARRPFESERPGTVSSSVTNQARDAGFSYMWTKSYFGVPRVVHREAEFVAMTLTAGRWEGWSPFYTVASVSDLRRAERRLLRTGAPGWLVGTIDAPLWALSGEIFDRGRELVEVARFAAGGGRSGELVNVTPNVIARYARILVDADMRR